MKTRMIRWLRQGALAAVASSLVFMGASMVGGTYSPPDAVVKSASLDWDPQFGTAKLLWVEKFNPLLGQLQGVRISVERFDGDGLFCVENLTTTPCLACVHQAVTLRLWASSGGVLQGEPVFVVVGDSGEHFIPLEGCDEHPDDFQPPGGATYTLSYGAAGLPAVRSYSMAAGDDMVPFLGPGWLEYLAGTTSHMSAELPDNANLVVTSVGNLLVRVTYDFLPSTPDPPPEPLGTGTIGYWKNHPAAWPVVAVEIGCQTYPREVAIARILRCSGSNPSLLLAKQLIAAKLNVEPAMANESGCIAAAIERADELLCLYPPGAVVSKVVRTEMGHLAEQLTAYNEGRMCAPSREALGLPDPRF